jgi:hypothetical protein
MGRAYFRVISLGVASTLARALAFGVTVMVVEHAGTGSFPFHGPVVVVSAFLFAGGLGALLPAVTVRLMAGMTLGLEAQHQPLARLLVSAAAGATPAPPGRCEKRA